MTHRPAWMDCPECRYLQQERSRIHEFDGKATRQQAEEWAKSERCAEHQEQREQVNLL